MTYHQHMSQGTEMDEEGGEGAHLLGRGRINTSYGSHPIVSGEQHTHTSYEISGRLASQVNSDNALRVSPRSQWYSHQLSIGEQHCSLFENENPSFHVDDCTSAVSLKEGYSSSGFECLGKVPGLLIALLLNLFLSISFGQAFFPTG